MELGAGDANLDGFMDIIQGYVASFRPSPDLRYLTLIAPQDSFLKEVTSLTTQDIGEEILGVSFPVKLTHFIVKCPSAGRTQTVTMSLPRGVSVTGCLNYGPTTDNPESHYYSFMLADGLGAVIGSKSVTLYLKDGDWGDNDLSANGLIELVVGPTQMVILTNEPEKVEVTDPPSVQNGTTEVEDWMNYE